MTDDSTRPPTPESAPGEQPSPPETGWPAAAPPPSWTEVEGLEGTSDEQELDAWLDAQDEAVTEPPSGDEGTGGVEAADETAHDVGEPAEERDEPGVEAAGPTPPGDEPAAEAPEPEAPEAEVPAPGDPAVDDTEPVVVAAAGPVEDASEPTYDESEPVVEHGSDQDAAELAGAALFAPVPAAVVPAPTTPDDAPDTSDAPGTAVALAEDEPATEAAAPATGGSAVPGERPATAVVALLVALVLVLAGLTAFLAQRSVSTRGGGGVEHARHDGLQAARNAARIVFSYDYRHLDKDFAAGKALTTGAFADQYGTTTPKLVEVAKTYKAVVAADVSDAAVISAASSKVVVLVFVNQQSTSTLAAAPKITQSRVTMTMVHRGGRWLVSDVHAF